MFLPLFTIVLIVSLALVIFLNHLEAKAEKKRNAEEIAAIAPGVYIWKNEIDNPFMNEYDYIRVYEVKDGWVRYTFTRADRSADASAMRSITGERFIRIYVRHPFD